MTTNTTYQAIEFAQRWHDFWRGGIGEWLLTKGLKIALLVIFAVLAARFINWTAVKISRRIDADFQQTDQLVRTESAKHRQAVASVISWVSIAILLVVVLIEITDVIAIPVGSLVAPAAVLGAALGFGAQRIVQDLLAGFFIITEKQYGFGDLVALTVSGIAAPAEGTVEDVTLRVTKLRSTEGEVFTIPNGQIAKTMNLSKDWARAVVDIPVPTSADLTRVDEVLHGVSDAAMADESLRKLLLDAPQVMGVESIELDTVNLRMVARTLARQAVRGRPSASSAGGRRADPCGHRHPCGHVSRGEHDSEFGERRLVHRATGFGGPPVTFWKWLTRRRPDHGWPGYIINGRIRTSTASLIVAFLAIAWLHNAYQPTPPRAHGAGDTGGAPGVRARSRVHVGAADLCPAAYDHVDHDDTHHHGDEHDRHQHDGASRRRADDRDRSGRVRPASAPDHHGNFDRHDDSGDPNPRRRRRSSPSSTPTPLTPPR